MTALDMEKWRRFKERAAIHVAERRAFERFDRCCHGGIVAYRLPLWYRIACANGAAE